MKNSEIWLCLTIVSFATFIFLSPKLPTLHQQQEGHRSAIVSEDMDLVLLPDFCDSPIRGHFDEIYESGLWQLKMKQPSDFYNEAEWPPNDNQRISASGPGSDLGSATVTSLKIIKDTITKFDVKSMVDIPCGDVNWIFDSFETDTLPMYVGLDIAGAVIKVNQKRFAHHRNKQFHFWDATSCILPKFRNGTNDVQAFDLVQVRDVIMHMPLELGVAFYCNVFKAGPKVLVTTSYPNRPKNTNIKEGNHYPNNLWVDPFNFPRIDCTPTHPAQDAQLTCVYDLREDWVQEFIISKC